MTERGCAESQPQQRPIYAKPENCQADWSATLLRLVSDTAALRWQRPIFRLERFHHGWTL